MKKNDEIKELTPEQIRLVENFCKKVDLEDLTLEEKIAINFALNSELTKFTANKILDSSYPRTHLSGAGSTANNQDLQILIALFSLKRDLENNKNQKKLIEQNDKIIELLTKISEKQ